MLFLLTVCDLPRRGASGYYPSVYEGFREFRASALRLGGGRMDLRIPA